MDLDKFIITKIIEAHFWYAKCPNCGYKNIPEYRVKVCPDCGTDLKFGNLKNIEC